MAPLIPFRFRTTRYSVNPRKPQQQDREGQIHLFNSQIAVKFQRVVDLDTDEGYMNFLNLQLPGFLKPVAVNTSEKVLSLQYEETLEEWVNRQKEENKFPWTQISVLWEKEKKGVDTVSRQYTRPSEVYLRVVRILFTILTRLHTSGRWISKNFTARDIVMSGDAPVFRPLPISFTTLYEQDFIRNYKCLKTIVEDLLVPLSEHVWPKDLEDLFGIVIHDVQLRTYRKLIPYHSSLLTGMQKLNLYSSLINYPQGEFNLMDMSSKSSSDSFSSFTKVVGLQMFDWHKKINILYEEKNLHPLLQNIYSYSSKESGQQGLPTSYGSEGWQCFWFLFNCRNYMVSKWPGVGVKEIEALLNDLFPEALYILQKQLCKAYPDIFDTIVIQALTFDAI